jgi:hypothetical protein
MGITHLDSQCVVDTESCERNLHEVLSRGYSQCVPLPERTGKLAVVGSGPSVSDYLDELKSWDGEIWATNGAYNYLLDHGIVAHGFCGVDPLPGLAEYVKQVKPETTCYLSGLCDISVFEALDRGQIRVWFPSQEPIKFPHGCWVVPGGTTMLTRAPFLAKMLGWRDVTIYGADSSYARLSGWQKLRAAIGLRGWRYVYKDGRFAEDSKAPLNRVICNGEVFDTEIGLIKQVSQFGVIAQWPEIKLTFKCGGLLDAYLRAPTEEHDLHARTAA